VSCVAVIAALPPPTAPPADRSGRAAGRSSARHVISRSTATLAWPGKSSRICRRAQRRLRGGIANESRCNELMGVAAIWGRGECRASAAHADRCTGISQDQYMREENRDSSNQPHGRFIRVDGRWSDRPFAGKRFAGSVLPSTGVTVCGGPSEVSAIDNLFIMAPAGLLARIGLLHRRAAWPLMDAIVFRVTGLSAKEVTGFEDCLTKIL